MHRDIRAADLALRNSGPSGLFVRNRAWAESKVRTDPTFFSRLVGQQRPRYFWIGCSDSRVPATEIVDLEPGEMFVHRNVANLEIADDPSFAAALQFAVEILEVQHIMIVGHQGCGGIKAATESETDDPIGRWLTPIRRLYEDCVQEKTKDRAEARTLCEVNVATQVPTLAVNPIVRKAWTRDCDLTLPGWVYAIGDGLLHEVCVPVREAPGATFGIPDRRRSRKNPDNCSD